MRNEPNIATPMRKPVMFVASTGRSASTRMSTSGWLRRSSNATKTPRTATPPSSATIVLPEPQPHAFAFEMPSSSAASPSESSAAPAQSIRVRSRAGEAGTTRWTSERRGQREQADPEEPGDVGVVDDRARQRQADAAADAEHRRDHADGHRAPLGRQLVVDDPEGQREHAARDALDHAPGDDHLDRAGERRDDRAEGEDERACRSARAPCRTGRRACPPAACTPRPRAGSR